MERPHRLLRHDMAAAPEGAGLAGKGGPRRERPVLRPSRPKQREALCAAHPVVPGPTALDTLYFALERDLLIREATGRQTEGKDTTEDKSDAEKNPEEEAKHDTAGGNAEGDAEGDDEGDGEGDAKEDAEEGADVDDDAGTKQRKKEPKTKQSKKKNAKAKKSKPSNWSRAAAAQAISSTVWTGALFF